MLKDKFKIPVGLSDHSRDPHIGPIAAVAAGADIIEKHFTLDNSMPGPDHKFAVEPDELKSMVQNIRMTEKALGIKEKISTDVEKELRDFARRSIFAIKDIEKGELFSAENIDVLRKGCLAPGLLPERYESLLGKRASRSIKAETAIVEEDVQ